MMFAKSLVVRVMFVNKLDDSVNSLLYVEVKVLAVVKVYGVVM